MSTELSAISHALLGMLCLRGPSTAYDLKRAMGRLSGEFFSVGHTQHYAETARLEEMGLLRSQQEDTGRRRRVYTITPEGRAEVAAWLGSPAGESMQIRDVAQLKLFFGELATRADLVRLAEEQVRLYRARLEQLEWMEAEFGGRTDLGYRIASLELGRAVYRAGVEFWSGVADDPDSVVAQPG